jgi:16S rRNA (guanine1207-N2)-methyltransferase
MSDPALSALFLPFAEGELDWPATGRALFLRARPHEAMRGLAQQRWVCEQGFRPMADALARTGYTQKAAEGERFPLVLLLPPRQRDEARAALAQAILRAEPDGIVLACQANREGARSGEADLRELAGDVRSRSKQHCRAYWAKVTTEVQASPRVREWALYDAPRAIADGRFQSRPGVFAWDRIDAGSALLAQHLPHDLSGRAADLGAGYGYLSTELLSRNPGLVALDLYEAEARALDMARLNLADAAKRVELGFHWHDVAGGVPGRYDAIVSNPPFHQGRADAPDLGRAFIAAAARALRPGGVFWMVANRHLPYEAALARSFDHRVRCVVERGGYKVFEAVRGAA